MLPMRMGGLGSRSAARIDAFHMIFWRLHHIAHFHSSGGDWRSRRELQNACVTFVCFSFVGRPLWAQLRSGARPPLQERAEFGEWQRGWQCFAFFLQLPISHLVGLWSERDVVLCANHPCLDLGKTSSPSGHNELQVRVRWVCGHVGPSPCCMPPGQGDSGPRQSFRRGHWPECRESRGSVSWKRQVARHVHHSGSERCLGFRIATAPPSPPGGGHYVAKRRQCSMRGMCECSSCVRSRCAQHRGTRRPSTPSWLKEISVVPIETGGRWGDEAIRFIDALDSVRSREVLSRLQRFAFLVWRRRWTRMLAFCCSQAFAGSLTSNAEATEGVDGADLFGQDWLQGVQF